LVEPLSRSLANSPVEDEEITRETAVALERSRASLSRGEGISHEDVIREFGFVSGDDFTGCGKALLESRRDD